MRGIYFQPIIYVVVLTVIAYILGGCDLVRRKSNAGGQIAERKVLARVNDKFLYLDEIKGIFDKNSTSADSTARVLAYIDRWVRKQLVIAEAMKQINIDEIELERKVLDYRYSLIGYEYQNYYINRNFNDSISDEEIVQYYEANQDNFILKQNIVRGTYIKVPKSAPRTGELKSLIFSSDQKDLEVLKSYCLSFSVAYTLLDDVWHEFDKLTVNSPLSLIPNKIEFLKTNPYYESVDSGYLYFLKVEEYKISDNMSPIEFVKEEIINIILNKRKAELVEMLEQQIYEKAIEKKYFEIYY